MLLLTLLFSLLTNGSALAGDKVGNGGGLWICREGGEIRRATLVDLFEAEAEFGLKIVGAPPGAGVEELYRRERARLAAELPWMEELLAPHFLVVEQKLKPLDVLLTPTRDSLERAEPSPALCGGARWEYAQFANFTDYGTLLVQKNLWEAPAIPALHKAALLFHEAVYLWLRAHPYRDSSSVRARRLVGVLFSELSPEMKGMSIDELFGGKRPELPRDSGVIDDARGITLSAFLTAGAPAILHRADAEFGSRLGTSGFGRPCRIANDAVGSDRDITCALELGEAQAFHDDLTLRLHVPSFACAFVRVTPYSFYALPAGTGPELVSHEVLEDGTIVDGPYTSNGQVKECEFNHTGRGGPNCCAGTYRRQTIERRAGKPPLIHESKNLWGGQPSACLAGPATLTQEKHPDGNPKPSLYYTANTGMNRGFEFPAPDKQRIESLPGQSLTWNVNYYDPLKGVPAGMLSQTQEFIPSAAYAFECLDAAGDLKARVRLAVRKWNSEVREGLDPASGPNDFPGWDDSPSGFPWLDRLQDFR